MPTCSSADMLFATLDPTSRRVTLPTGQRIVVTDTVGFINKLPHDLVEAFRATLEEVLRADLLVEVVDAADPDFIGQQAGGADRARRAWRRGQATDRGLQQDRPAGARPARRGDAGRRPRGLHQRRNAARGSSCCCERIAGVLRARWWRSTRSCRGRAASSSPAPRPRATSTSATPRPGCASRATCPMRSPPRCARTPRNGSAAERGGGAPR